MATNKFLVFDEHALRSMTDAAYELDQSRAGGIPENTVADSALHNKLFHQVSTMTAAIAMLLASELTSDVQISDSDLSALVDHIKRVFVTKNSLLGDIKNVDGNGSGIDAPLFGGREPEYYRKGMLKEISFSSATLNRASWTTRDDGLYQYRINLSGCKSSGSRVFVSPRDSYVAQCFFCGGTPENGYFNLLAREIPESNVIVDISLCEVLSQ